MLVQIQSVAPIPFKGIMYGIICQIAICYSEVSFSQTFLCYSVLQICGNSSVVEREIAKTRLFTKAQTATLNA